MVAAVWTIWPTIRREREIMNYDEWSYENLLNLKSQLEEHIQSGQPLQKNLRDVNKEIAGRRFALVAVLGGRIRKEYGRWKVSEQCHEQAKRMGLPVGRDFEFQGHKFETSVIELF
jgi:hypothetical protein